MDKQHWTEFIVRNKKNEKFLFSLKKEPPKKRKQKKQWQNVQTLTPLPLSCTTNFIEFKTYYLKDTSVWMKCQRRLHMITLKTCFIW